MQTTDGKTLTQERNVPLGSNWPSKKVNAAPRPTVEPFVKSAAAL
ncbi:MAG: hypothetical protein AAF892_15180 [Cyanobacteria bacterium P01_D01_bin.71]